VRFRCANFKAETIEGVCEITGMEKYLVNRVQYMYGNFQYENKVEIIKAMYYLVEVAHKSVTHTHTRASNFCTKSSTLKVCNKIQLPTPENFVRIFLQDHHCQENTQK